MDKSNKPKESAAFITSRDTLDGAYTGLVLGINAKRLGMDTSVFYTFMGILHFYGYQCYQERMGG